MQLVVGNGDCAGQGSDPAAGLFLWTVLMDLSGSQSHFNLASNARITLIIAGVISARNKPCQDDIECLKL